MFHKSDSQTHLITQEENMRANFFKKIPMVVLAGILILNFFIHNPGLADANELKWRLAAYFTKQEFKPVGDAEGHVTGQFTRRGLAFFENGDVAIVALSGSVDAIKGKGSIPQVEAHYVFEDGSSWVALLKGTFGPQADGKVHYEMEGDFVSGTGRFEGISGKMTSKGKLLTPFAQETRGDAFFDATATYVTKK